jgi:5,10-methylenetetrahydromethanopterin reductase
VRKHVEAGAAKAGRSGKDLPIVSLTHVCVLKPGEALDSPRVKAMTGPWVMASLHAIAAGYARPTSLPPGVAKIYDEYAAHVARMPESERYLHLHVGHCSFVASEERKFVTAETIGATTIVGQREALIDQLRALGKAGLSQIFLNPPLDGFNECLDDISRELIEKV